MLTSINIENVNIFIIFRDVFVERDQIEYKGNNKAIKRNIPHTQ